MTLIIIALHCLVNVSLGYSLIHIIKGKKKGKLWFIEAFLIGAFIETMLGFILMIFGINELFAFFINFIIASSYLLYHVFISKKVNFSVPKFSYNFNLWEIVLIVPIVIKLLIALYQLIKFPLYYDDAMTHWSGRAHALYSKVNWSMDSTSDFFLGSAFGFKEYPLFLVIWRSINAGLCGGWNDTIAKADSFIFYVLVIISVYCIVRKLSYIRWHALAAAFVTSAVPLMHVHGTSGYSEIAICLIILVLYNALLENSYLKAGLLTALCIWTKNEGLFIFFPIFSLVSLYLLLSDPVNSYKKKLLSFATYVLSTLLFISPWLIFKKINNISLSVVSSSESFYHSGSFILFIEKLFNNPSSNIFWIVFFIFLLIGIRNWLKKKELVVAFIIVITTLILLGYVFCFTGAHKFLVDDMTPHRSLLQIVPIATIFLILSMSESQKQNKISPEE